MLEAFSPTFFEADRDLVSGALRLTHERDLLLELSAYEHHPANDRLLRVAFGRPSEPVAVGPDG